MLKLVWKEDCEIGIELIDSQHHRLVDILNALAVQIEGLKQHKRVDDALVTIAEELEDYTRTHFSDEEALYLERGKDITEHVKLHEKFTDDVAYVKAILLNVNDETDVVKLLDVYRGLLNWFMNHIKEDDKDFWE